MRNFNLVKKLYLDARLPEKSTMNAGCWDLFCHQVIIDSNKPYWEYRTGISIELLFGYDALLLPRSSISKTGQIMCNAPGYIDNDYKGEIIFRTYPISPKAYHFNPGDKICQIKVVSSNEADGYLYYQNEDDRYVICPTKSVIRGTGGFGSTGR